jgi:glycosyltransferase involved in cell wall biosynthesis
MEWWCGYLEANKMKIAIDVSQIVYETGVSVYTRKLVESLFKIDKENEYVLFAGALRRRADVRAVFPQTKIFPIPPIAADIIWNKLHILPVEKLVGQVDVFHSSDWAEPPSRAFKVTTIHDLYPLKFARLVHPEILEVHRRKLSWAIQECKRIIVPSLSTQKDLAEIGVKKDVIRIIPEAPSLSKTDAPEVTAVKKKYNLQGDYLISIGITPLKNTKRIIEAFHLSKAGKGLKLVLVGRPVNLKIDEERDIRILGHIPQDDLAALLTGSRALIFTSLYEGFGVPILDAFNCDVPVVTSNTASMPEVAGEAAVLVDPYKVDSIAEGVIKALRGGRGLVEKGSRRVKDFSWEATAQKTLDVYREAKS